MATLTQLFLRKTLLFVFFGLTWVIFTDYVLLWLIPSLPQFALWQTAKGLLYVIATTGVFYLLLTDTYRREQQAFARQSEIADKYELLFDHNPLPMWVYDLETLTFLAVNRAAKETYGYSQEEFINMTLQDIRPVEDIDRLLKDVEKPWPPLNFAGEWRHKRKDGTVFQVEITSHALHYDGRNARLVVAQDITNRHETESRMQLLSASLEAVANAIVLTDIDGKIEWVNSAFLELTGFTREEALGKNPRELVKSGKHGQAFYEEMWNTILSGQVWRGELINRRKDGSLYIEEESITPVRNQTGEIAHFIAVKQDISQRKRVESALQESELRYRSLFEDNQVVMLLIDPQDGAIVDANHAAANFYGWSREALKRKKIGEINSLSPAEVQLEMERAKNEERSHFYFRHRLANGRIRDVEVTSGPVHVEGRALLYSTIFDVTEQKEAEQERERLLAQVQVQAEQVTQIMYSVPAGVCLLDPNGMVLMANPKAEAKLSFLANISVGDKLLQLGERPLASLLTSPPLGEWHGVEKNGRIFQVIAQPLENGPIPQGWVVVIWEVTEQRMIQRQLQSQERLAVVGQLAAGIAHDFNNILAIIALYAQNLQQSAKLSANEKNRLAIIDQQAQRASQLVQQVLDFSRRAVMSTKSLDMLPLLKEEVKLLQRTLPEHITIQLKYTERSCFVQADPTRLQQVVMNLALNARDAMPEGGSLLIEVDRIKVLNQKQAPLPQMKPGNWLRWRVSDSGSGIEPALLDHVFEPFFTTKEPGQGTGLGLAQVHGIVGQHGGHITVQSQRNAGTTFTIYLPAFEAQPTPPPTDVEETVIPQGNGELILIVEDNPPLREALTEVLTSWNYNVAAAADGLEALALLKNSYAGDPSGDKRYGDAYNGRRWAVTGYAR